MSLEQFLAAAEWLSASPAAASLSAGLKLEVYGLYKFASSGSAPTTARPSIFNQTARAKHDAWSAQASKHNVESARHRYVDIAKEIGWTDSSSSTRTGLGGAKVSIMAPTESTSHSQLHDAVLDCNLGGVQAALQQGTDVNAVDEFGYTALHLAADRGYTEIISFLLETGADPVTQDEDGQTPLMLAQAAGRSDAMALLSHHKPTIV